MSRLVLYRAAHSVWNIALCKLQLLFCISFYLKSLLFGGNLSVCSDSSHKLQQDELKYLITDTTIEEKKPQQQDLLGARKTACRKGLGVWVDTILNMSQQCVIVAKDTALGKALPTGQGR